MNPEIKIESLYNSVMELLNTSSSFLQVNTIEEEENLRKVLRKILISKILYEKNIIAISGLQGVGKSTIIKNFYELNEESLPIVAGRGERIPILVTEYPVKKAEAYAIINRKNEHGLWVNEEINIEFDDLNKFARGEDLSAMLLGLRVPYKYFNNNVTSFLILPGFEGTIEDYWETLIDFSLTCASTIVFAVNEQKMADQQNKDKVMQILNEYKGIKPIFAMTFSDQSKDRNAQLRDTIKETFQIEEDTRIISVGAFSKEENQEWAENLLNAIGSYSAMTEDYRKKQLRQLKNLLRRDLMTSVRNIRNELSYIVPDRSMDQINEVLVVFDAEKEKIKGFYAKDLKAAFDECESNARTKAMKLVGDKSKLDKIRHAILSKNLEDLRKMEEHILSLMYDEKSSGNKETVFQRMNREVSTKIISERLGIAYEDNDGKVKVFKGIEGRISIIEASDQERTKKKGYFINKEVSNDLTMIMLKDMEVRKIESKDLAPVIKLIPAIATLNYGAFFKNIYLDTRSLEMKYESPQSGKWNNIIKAPDDIKKGIYAVAGISLVDSTDGKPDVILKAAEALGMKMTLQAAYAITGGIAAGALVAAILREINQNNYADLNQYTAGFRALRNYYEVKLIENYDEYIDNVRENLKLRLMEGYGIKLLDSRLSNLMIAINKVENNVIGMEGIISDSY